MSEAKADTAERFHELYQQDLAANFTRSLSDYIAQVGGDERIVRREYDQVESHGTEPLRPGSDPSPGGKSHEAPLRRLKHYVLYESIGAGGQGEVFRAYDELLERTVALKILVDRTDGGIERFVLEARAASRVEHEAICPVYDHGTFNNELYIAMRFVDGQTLEQHIRDASRQGLKAARLPVDPAQPSRHRDDVQLLLEFFIRCGEGIQAAHEAGLIHRDLKPSNLMVNSKGLPVVLDFGLARDVARQSARSERLVTAPYASPEQLDPNYTGNRSPRLDPQTDVYSLAVSLFECLTLRRPFQDLDWTLLYHSIMHTEAPSASSINRMVSSDLATVLQKALQKRPTDRYRGMAGFVDDLRRVRDGQPILAKPTTTWVRTRKWVRRNRAVSALLASLVVASFTATWFAVSAEASKRVIEQQHRLSDEAAARDLLRFNDSARAQAVFEQLSAAAAPDDYVRLELFSIECLAAQLEFEEARDRLNSLAPARVLPAPSGGMRWMLATELGSEQIDEDDFAELASGFAPADLAYAHAMVAQTVAEMVELCDEALTHDSLHRRARRLRATGHMFLGQRDLARDDARFLIGIHPAEPMGLQLRNALDAFEGRTEPRESDPPSVQKMFRFVSLSTELLEHAALSHLRPRFQFGSAGTASLLSSLNEAIGLISSLGSGSRSDVLLLPKALSNLFGIQGPFFEMICLPSAATAEAVLKVMPEPLAFVVRGKARLQAGDAHQAVRDFRAALRNRTLMGTGRGIRYSLFVAALDHEQSFEADQSAALHQIAVDAATELILDERAGTEWLKLLRRAAEILNVADVQTATASVLALRNR